MAHTITNTRSASASERSRTYSLLATALAYPTDAGIDGIVTAVAEGAPGYPPALRTLLEKLSATSSGDLATLGRSHQRLFPQIESPETPGYETAYRGNEIFNQAAIMADIAGFYRAFGLEVGGSTRERPDHVTVELEYLAFLCFKEALSGERGDDDQADICADAEKSFLTDHLGDWGPELGRRLEQHSDHEFFVVVGRLLDRWINLRLDELGVEPNAGAGALIPSVGLGGDDDALACEPSAWRPVDFKGNL